MNLTSKDKFKIQLINNKKKPFIKIPKLKNPYNELKTKNKIREEEWNKRFIFYKIPNYDSFRDKNVLCNKNKNNANLKKIDNYLDYKSPRNYILNQTNIDINNRREKNNSLFFSINNKIQTLSPKNKNFSFISKNVLSPIANIHISLYDYNNKNLTNLKNLWDELGILKPYRNYFKYIYKELETEYKEEMYLKEIQELNQVKINAKELKYHIGLRMSIIEEIKNLNDKLGKELVNKNNNAKELLLNEISDKIILLREQTIKVCQSMKKLKGMIFNINNLGKYDFDLISKKFRFDKNYIIKMKSELNFLREGFAKYYFNIENDQTPFLLKASNKNIITKEDYFIRIIPIDKEIKNTIINCLFYIHQELIAYQNININKNNFRRISPIKKKDNEFLDNKTHIEFNSFSNIKCMTDRENSKKINRIKEIKKQKEIEKNIEKDKDKGNKDDYSNKNININKDSENISHSNKNLKTKINDSIKPLVNDSYVSLNNKKESYDKDQILKESINKNDLIINNNQSSMNKKDNNLFENNKSK